VSRFVDKVTLDDALELNGKINETTSITLKKYLEDYSLNIEQVTANVNLYSDNSCLIRLEPNLEQEASRRRAPPEFAFQVKDSASHDIQTCLGIHSFFSHNIGNAVGNIELSHNKQLETIVNDYANSSLINSSPS